MRESNRNAYAKINLTLEILDRRADGYHNIRSVMQKITLCDRLSFQSLPDGEMTVECDKPVCAMTDNLAYRAAALYREAYRSETGKDFGIRIAIEKKIPDRAGLAGGSADAACVLDYLYDTVKGLSYDAVEEIAAKLGSDINFCLNRCRCAYCTDRGILYEPISPLRGVHIVLAVPSEGLKTPTVYAAFDASPVRFDDNPSEKVKEALMSGQNDAVFSHVCNAFTPVCSTLCPPIGVLISRMKEQNPDACEMSGSGSAVYALYSDEKAARRAFDILKKEYAACFLVNPLAD